MPSPQHQQSIERIPRNPMNSSSNSYDADSVVEEEKKLETALYDSDRLLQDALRADDRRRCVRRRVLFSLIVGGIVMGAIVVAALAGWLTLFAPPPAERQAAQAAAKKDRLSDRARIERADGLGREGWELWQKGSLDEAATKFEEAVKLDPDAANSWNGLGWARFNGGDGEGAITAFEKCVALEPKHPAGLNGLGQVYLSWREYDKAEKYLLKAGPKAPAAWFGLARLYVLTGKYDKAKVWIKKALHEQPDEESLKQLMAAAEKGQLSPELRKQIEPPGKPDTAPAAKLALEGWLNFNTGKARSAERSFREALAKDPDNLSAMNGLGFLLLNSGKTAEAKSYFEKCLEKEPEAAGPMNGLARCLKEEGKVDDAIALWEKMCKQNPGVNAGTVGLATTYAEKKQYDKALPYYEQLVKSQPNNEEYKRGLEEAKKALQSKQR